MMALKWLPEALDDLKRLHAFIEPHSLDAAGKAVSTIIEAAETLLSHPEKGKPWAPDTSFRELVVRFGARGYVLRYRFFENDIVIVRIWHSLEER